MPGYESQECVDNAVWVTAAKEMRPFSRADIVLVVVISAIVALCASFGSSIMDTGYYDDSFLHLVLRSLGFFPLIAALLLAGEYIFLVLALSSDRGIGAIWSFFEKATPSGTLKSIVVFSGVMLVLWSPWLIALFPGSMNWDTYYQIAQCYPENHPILFVPWYPSESYVSNYFSDHHPVFDTFIYGAFAMASDALFGTWNYGVFAFVVIQAIGTAAALVFAFAYCKNMGAPAVFCFIGYAACCLLPFFPINAATMLKDTLFSWLYIPYFIMVVEIVRSKGESFSRRSFVAWFAILGVLLSLTKKTGMYTTLAAAVILLVVYRKHWKGFAAQVGAVVIVMQLILPYVVFPALDVIPGGKQEVLSPLFQQTARYVASYGDETTEEERASIDAILDYDTLADRYDPLVSDPVKFMWNYNASSDEMKEYYKTWLKEGLNHPEVYVESMLATAAGYIAPGGPVNVHENTGDVEHAGSPLVWQPQQLDGFRNTMLSWYHALRDAPLLSDTVFSVALYAFWIPCFALYILFRYSKSYTMTLVPTVLALGICIITPAFHARYALPLIYTAPITLGLLAACMTNRQDPLHAR